MIDLIIHSKEIFVNRGGEKREKILENNRVRMRCSLKHKQFEHYVDRIWPQEKNNSSTRRIH